ncbi:hypothetical protein Tco_0489895 [Tanacetum coccineum]
MLATRGSGKVTTMEVRANKTKGIRCLEHTLLGQSTRRHMLGLYLCATSANFTIMDRALRSMGYKTRDTLVVVILEVICIKDLVVLIYLVLLIYEVTLPNPYSAATLFGGVTRVLFNRITEKQWEQHEEAAVSYADLKASINQYYDENIAHIDQTNKLVEASMSSLDRSSTTISDLYKGLDVITQLLKDINNAVKDDPAANQKINEASEIFARISSNITEAHALKQEEASTAWTKSSTNMAWNLGSRMTVVEISQTALKRQPSSAPLGSVTPTLALTHIPTNVEGENATNTASEEPPSHTKGETRDTTMAIPISSIQPTHDQPITSSGIHDKWESVYLTEQEIQEYWDKEEKMKKSAKEAKLLTMSRPEVIKVVRKQAKKLGIDPKEAISTKDAEHEVLKREHSKKPECIIDVRIHPNTNPIVASVFRDNDKRNFDVHQPFKFSDFRITELDELGPIIQKKKNSVVKDLMTSLSKRYERLKKIPEELGIQSALPALIPEQASSQSSGRKRKHMELEPEVKVHGLGCNRCLPKSVPFVNHMVIEEPEYGILFIDVFGDQAFPRWDDIHKVGVGSLVSYLVIIGAELKDYHINKY